MSAALLTIGGLLCNDSLRFVLFILLRRLLAGLRRARAGGIRTSPRSSRPPPRRPMTKLSAKYACSNFFIFLIWCFRKSKCVILYYKFPKGRVCVWCWCVFVSVLSLGVRD